MGISGKTTYLLIACFIALLFAGTGAYYIIDLQNKKVNEKTPENNLAQVDKQTPKPTIKPTNTPSPTSIPTYTPKPESSKKTESSDSAKVKEVYLSENIEDSLSTSCYSPCEYDIECPRDLGCEDVDGVSRCVNLDCTSNSTCQCDNETIDNLSALKSQNPTPNNNASENIGGINDLSTPIATPISTLIPDIPEDVQTYSANLPKAGSQEFTLAILAIGLAVTTIGVVWKKS